MSVVDYTALFKILFDKDINTGMILSNEGISCERQSIDL